MLAVITLFAMIAVEDADADQAVNHTGNTQPPGTSVHYWTGRIEQNTTWRDTVYVGGDITIASGVTLTLAPDTQVHFLPYRDDTQGGLDSTRAELIVEGRLHAQAEGIVFCSANALSLGADWYGIVVKRGGRADVSHATIRDGLRCLYAEAGGLLMIDNIAFANCGKPIGVSQNSTGLPKVTEREEGSGIRIAEKLVAGGLGGLGGGFVGGLVGVGGLIFFAPLVEANSTGGGIGVEFYPLLGFWIGDVVGTAASASRVDPLDNFRITLAGSALAGVGVPAAMIGMTAMNVMDENEFKAVFGWSALLAPVLVQRWRRNDGASPFQLSST